MASMERNHRARLKIWRRLGHQNKGRGGRGVFGEEYGIRSGEGARPGGRGVRDGSPLTASERSCSRGAVVDFWAWTKGGRLVDVWTMERLSDGHPGRGAYGWKRGEEGRGRRKRKGEEEEGGGRGRGRGGRGRGRGRGSGGRRKGRRKRKRKRREEEEEEEEEDYYRREKWRFSLLPGRIGVAFYGTERSGACGESSMVHRVHR